MKRHPERVPPWGHILAMAADKPEAFVSCDAIAVSEMATAFRGSLIEEVESSHELVTWPMYRTWIGEGVPADAPFWRKLYWLFRQERHLEVMAELKAEGWEAGRGEGFEER